MSYQKKTWLGWCQTKPSFGRTMTMILNEQSMWNSFWPRQTFDYKKPGESQTFRWWSIRRTFPLIYSRWTKCPARSNSFARHLSNCPASPANFAYSDLKSCFCVMWLECEVSSRDTDWPGKHKRTHPNDSAFPQIKQCIPISQNRSKPRCVVMEGRCTKFAVPLPKSNLHIAHSYKLASDIWACRRQHFVATWHNHNEWTNERTNERILFVVIP